VKQKRTINLCKKGKYQLPDRNQNQCSQMLHIPGRYQKQLFTGHVGCPNAASLPPGTIQFKTERIINLCQKTKTINQLISGWHGGKH